MKRSRSQSQEAPRRFSCRMIVPPDSSFHFHTRWTNASRPSAWRVVPSAASCRSTTTCVAIPAWSIPGCQRALNPSMRFQRTRMSWSVLFSAWPMWSEPVTFGGGMTMQYGFALEKGSARK